VPSAPNAAPHTVVRPGVRHQRARTRAWRMVLSPPDRPPAGAGRGRRGGCHLGRGTRGRLVLLALGTTPGTTGQASRGADPRYGRARYRVRGVVAAVLLAHRPALVALSGLVAAAGQRACPVAAPRHRAYPGRPAAPHARQGGHRGEPVSPGGSCCRYHPTRYRVALVAILVACCALAIVALAVLGAVRYRRCRAVRRGGGLAVIGLVGTPSRSPWTRRTPRCSPPHRR
jgi:hypothetical protein